jgi:hypothetical protein
VATKANEDRYREALHRHWEAERREFNLHPSDVPPCLAGSEECKHPPASFGFISWPRSRALRARILAANPHHYDDLER